MFLVEIGIVGARYAAKPTSEPRSGFYSERFDIYCLLSKTGPDRRRERRGTGTRETTRKPRQNFSVSKKPFPLSLTLPFSSPSFSIEAPNKAPTFGHHFCSKSRKEGIFGVVKRISTCGISKFQIVMAAQLIHDRVEMECLEGTWETLEGNTRC
ncbi:hypothetical protein GmHk_02G004496 [Glycine max]|nr:hypothetical protein GmHk_02G004496 [Glycine max]